MGLADRGDLLGGVTTTWHACCREVAAGSVCTANAISTQSPRESKYPEAPLFGGQG
jgi:hypothetical protein